MRKITVPYLHDPANLATIWLAIGDRKRPVTGWLPAYRDLDERGRRIIFARFERVPTGVVSIWVRDTAGERILPTKF